MFSSHRAAVNFRRRWGLHRFGVFPRWGLGVCVVRSGDRGQMGIAAIYRRLQDLAPAPTTLLLLRTLMSSRCRFSRDVAACGWHRRPVSRRTCACHDAIQDRRDARDRQIPASVCDRSRLIGLTTLDRSQQLHQQQMQRLNSPSSSSSPSSMPYSYRSAWRCRHSYRSAWRCRHSYRSAWRCRHSYRSAWRCRLCRPLSAMRTTDRSSPRGLLTPLSPPPPPPSAQWLLQLRR
jgi:hypothetical protein